ncbi:MAG: sigma factor [Gemmataceae bacterium]|nr:sigma factor [Gemmataceae bacterium]
MFMDSGGSVSTWIDRLKAGDPDAAGQLWVRYFRQLVAQARARLGGATSPLADEEDLALSAFDSLCQGVRQGRFPYLYDRGNLWRLLITLVAQKVIGLYRRERRLKRGGAVAPDAAITDPADLLAAEPPPDVLAQMTEECDRLLARLENDTLRAVALLRLEGYTVEEIAVRLGCVPRTVERKLEMIRRLWGAETRA